MASSTRPNEFSCHGMSELSRRGFLGGNKVDELELCVKCVYVFMASRNG